MKVTKACYYSVKIRSNAGGGVYWFLLKLETDEGIEGWGEIIWNHYRPGTLRHMIDDIAEKYVHGKDPFNVELNFAKLFAKHSKFHTDLGTMGIASGFEIACWDIKRPDSRSTICWAAW